MKSEIFIKFRVKNRQGEIVAYETYRPEFGWWHWRVSETTFENDVEYRNLRQGTLNESSYYREMFTGVLDRERDELYDTDELVDKDGKVYVIFWHKHQTGWFVELKNPKDILDYGCNSLTLYMHSREQRLGDGYSRRQDLKLKT